MNTCAVVGLVGFASGALLVFALWLVAFRRLTLELGELETFDLRSWNREDGPVVALRLEAENGRIRVKMPPVAAAVLSDDLMTAAARGTARRPTEADEPVVPS